MSGPGVSITGGVEGDDALQQALQLGLQAGQADAAASLLQSDQRLDAPANTHPCFHRGLLGNRGRHSRLIEAAGGKGRTLVRMTSPVLLTVRVCLGRPPVGHDLSEGPRSHIFRITEKSCNPTPCACLLPAQVEVLHHQLQPLSGVFARGWVSLDSESVCMDSAFLQTLNPVYIAGMLGLNRADGSV